MRDGAPDRRASTFVLFTRFVVHWKCQLENAELPLVTGGIPIQEKALSFLRSSQTPPTKSTLTN